MASAGTSDNLGVWAIINCGLFLACGLFFLTVAWCYPGLAAKEIDATKLKSGGDTESLIDPS